MKITSIVVKVFTCNIDIIGSENSFLVYNNTQIIINSMPLGGKRCPN